MFSKFMADETGAVTIDWVALTAGILLLGIAVVYGIFEGGVSQLATSINSNLSTAVNPPGGIETPPEVGDFSATE
jgi:Flp pilus assembly pilin Flp